jgi:16S rRNA (cytosine967-C5)-methyltransferase
MIVQKEREVAIYILKEILEEKAYNNIALKKAYKKNKQLTTTQKAFITELVNGTLRNLIYIDYIINNFSKVKTDKMKPFILYVLRISIFQLQFMDKVPESAVCNEAVKITKEKGFQNLSGFVNGVLRNSIRSFDTIVFPSIETDPIAYLSVKYSYPEWIIKYWLQEMDLKQIEEICNDSGFSYKVTLCVNTTKIDKESLSQILLKEGMEVKEGKSSNNSLLVKKTSDISEKDSYKKGFYHIMDESSMLAVEAANIQEDDFVIDLCAAPGGKSFYSAYIMNNKGKIISRDIYEHKINLITEGAFRLGIDTINAQNKDSRIVDETLIGKADVLIIDVPCSGLGLARKKPDIKYIKKIEEINSLVEVQRQIIKASINYLKIGGTLIYSTCTISKQENIDNINFILQNYDFEAKPICDYLPQSLKSESSKKGFVQILPNKEVSDGFFIAKLRKKG